MGPRRLGNLWGSLSQVVSVLRQREVLTTRCAFVINPSNAGIDWGWDCGSEIPSLRIKGLLFKSFKH